MATDAAGREIIVFDGKCVLCSANAQFVLRHDRDRHFAIAAMQGEVGSGIYRSLRIDPNDPDTLLVVTPGEVLRNSDAVLHIYRRLGWPWRAAGVLRFIPRAIRDPLYLIVARNRYRLFGRREACWVPADEDRERLLP